MAQTGEKLYTLTEVSKATGISMPTLQRYKKLFQSRIPSQGKGRTQRYPKEAFDIFKTLKDENMERRGRPRKNPEAPAAKPRARKAAPKRAAKAKPKGRAKAKAAAPKAPEGLLTLTQIGKVTGISYPTLLRYVSMHLKQIPHKGTGRTRRFLPEAVDVFKRLREESRRGRAAKKPAAKKAAPKRAAKKAAPKRAAAASTGDAALNARVKDLEKTIRQLEKHVLRVEKALQKPLRLTLQR